MIYGIIVPHCSATESLTFIDWLTRVMGTLMSEDWVLIVVDLVGIDGSWERAEASFTVW